MFYYNCFSTVLDQEGQRKKEVLELNGTQQLLVYDDDDVTLMGENINTKKENREAMLGASKEAGSEVKCRQN
jgi:hypothetical protein